jgi:hypothetical protein
MVFTHHSSFWYKMGIWVSVPKKLKSMLLLSPKILKKQCLFFYEIL